MQHVHALACGMPYVAVSLQLSLLRISSGGRPVSIGDIVTVVESEPDVVRLKFSVADVISTHISQYKELEEVDARYAVKIACTHGMHHRSSELAMADRQLAQSF